MTPFTPANASEFGTKGGESLLAKYGREFYAAIGRKGGKASRSRALTDEQVRGIRSEVARGCTQTSLAEAYGVSRYTIGNIIQGKAYQDVSE